MFYSKDTPERMAALLCETNPFFFLTCRIHHCGWINNTQTKVGINAACLQITCVQKKGAAAGSAPRACGRNAGLVIISRLTVIKGHPGAFSRLLETDSHLRPPTLSRHIRAKGDGSGSGSGANVFPQRYIDEKLIMKRTVRRTAARLTSLLRNSPLRRDGGENRVYYSFRYYYMCFAAPLSGVWCAAFISCCLRRGFFSFLDVKKKKIKSCRSVVFLFCKFCMSQKSRKLLWLILKTIMQMTV